MNLGTPRFRLIRPLQHKSPCPFAQNKPIPIRSKWTASGSGFIQPCGQGPHLRKSLQGEGMDSRLGSAHKHDINPASSKQHLCPRHGLGATGTG
jgi:hypothetical protein